MKLALIVPMLLTAGMLCRAAAAETVFYQGVHYKGVEVSDATGTMANINAEGGKSVTVPISALPTALKEKALKISRAKAENEARAAQRSGATPKPAGEVVAEVKVVQVMKEGLLVSGGGQTVLLKGHPQAGKVAVGAVLKFRGVPENTFTYVTVQGAAATVRAFRVTGVE
jgi:hypothetical protein